MEDRWLARASAAGSDPRALTHGLPLLLMRVSSTRHTLPAAPVAVADNADWKYVNTHPNALGSALHEAVNGGHSEIVHLLLQPCEFWFDARDSASQLPLVSCFKRVST